MSENTVHRKRSRHIDVRKYYVQEFVEEKLIKLMPCGTKEMTADALARSLLYPAFKTHAQCHITTRNTRSRIVACKCLLDMGIEKASGDGEPRHIFLYVY